MTQGAIKQNRRLANIKGRDDMKGIAVWLFRRELSWFEFAWASIVMGVLRSKPEIGVVAFFVMLGVFLFADAVRGRLRLD
jgi:hypothetical protein